MKEVIQGKERNRHEASTVVTWGAHRAPGVGFEAVCELPDLMFTAAL